MNCVLITTSGGVVKEVKFFGDYKNAIDSLCQFARTMDPEKEDAGIYSPKGLLAKAREFLDDAQGPLAN
jgi:hypothetical protein